jgi:hypothetical protein
MRATVPPGLLQLRLICEVEAVTAVKPVGVEERVAAEAGAMPTANTSKRLANRTHNRGRHNCSDRFLILNGAPLVVVMTVRYNERLRALGGTTLRGRY